MTPTKEQCPDCGAFSTVLHSDNAYECFACRRITYHEGFRNEPDYESWYLQDLAENQGGCPLGFATGS